VNIVFLNNILEFTHKIFESKWFKYTALIVFSIIIGCLKFNHIFERDESQVLLIVNNNRNIFDLFGTFGYEGTTGLWHVLLWFFSWIIPITPLSASIIHFTIIILFVWFLFFKIELPLIFKLLFLTQISMLWFCLSVRQYIFIPLLLSFFIYNFSKKNKLWINLSIVLIMQIHVTSVPIAISLWIYFILNEIRVKNNIFKIINLIPIAGLIVAIIQLMPPIDLTEGLRIWKPIDSINSIISFLSLSFNKIFKFNSIILSAIFSLLLLYPVIKGLIKNRKHFLICFFSFLFCFGIFLFIGITKYLGLKHYYLLFYTLLTFIVLVSINQKMRYNKIWYIALIPLFVYSAYLMRVKIADYMYAPFSYANKVAYCLDENYKDKTVLIIPEHEYSSVILYRTRSTPIFSLRRNEYYKYTIWNHPCVDHQLNKEISSVKVSELTKEIKNVPVEILKKNPVLVISSAVPTILTDETGVPVTYNIKINNNIELKFIKSFDGNSLNFLTEKFILYEVNYKDY